MTDYKKLKERWQKKANERLKTIREILAFPEKYGLIVKDNVRNIIKSHIGNTYPENCKGILLEIDNWKYNKNEQERIKQLEKKENG